MKPTTPSYNEDILQLCRWFRKHATHAEREFWTLVRNRQIHGKKFFRQYPITVKDENGREQIFIADFYCRALRLVVEIDGGIHETQREYDRLRTYLSNVQGIKVVRFSNNEVVNDQSEVKKQLETVVQKNTQED